MQHWFEGYPARIILAYVTEPCADTGYAKARSQLQEIFGGTSDSVIPLMEQLTSGKQIGKNDLEAHLSFLSDLLVADATSQQMGQRGNLDNRDRIAKIIESRLKYYAEKYYELDIDLRLELPKGFDFNKLRETVNKQIKILQQRQLMTGGQPQQQVKVNSTATAPQQQKQQQQQPQAKKLYSKVLKESPKKVQSTASCNICKGMHWTETCNLLLKLSNKNDQRGDLVKQHQLCYHCLEGGHVARFCKNVPACGTCGKPHHTIFHGRKAQPKKELNVHATAFKQAQTPPVDSSTNSFETNPEGGRQGSNLDVMRSISEAQDSTRTLQPTQLQHPQANLAQTNL